MVFTGFSHVRACAHDAKIYWKSFRTRFSTESRVGSSSKVAFFELPSLKMVSRAPQSALGGLLGRLWGPPGRSWGALGALLGALGALLGRSWAALGGLLAALGRSWTPMGDLGLIFDPPKVDFGSLRGSIFDPPRVDWGASCRRLASGSRAACS